MFPDFILGFLCRFCGHQMMGLEWIDLERRAKEATTAVVILIAGF